MAVLVLLLLFQVAAEGLGEKVRRYRETLVDYLQVLQENRATALRQVKTFELLFEQGLISRLELEQQREQLEEVDSSISAQRRELQLTGHLLAELEAEKGLPPLSEAGIIRYAGRPAQQADFIGLSSFFQNQFARAIPVSAFGQTLTHETLGFDHRGRIDIALHPSSPEGLAVISYLRQNDISFIAFSEAVSGSATGAHIHVGPPSNRLP